MLAEGWNVLSDRTSLYITAGAPTKIRTTARDLDAAFDLAAQHYGAPLEYQSEWRRVAHVIARGGLVERVAHDYAVECDVAVSDLFDDEARS